MMAHAQYDLVIDVGNTRMKLGLFSGGRIVQKQAMPHGDLFAVERFVAERYIKQVAIGSVGKPDPSFLDALRQWAPVMEITANTHAPVSSRYVKLTTLGVDRLANVTGSAVFFPKRAVLAIDLGTCVTYDLVDELAVHQGGIIAPGMRMRAKAMHAYSARLPEVDPTEAPEQLGMDTATSLIAGVYHGLVLELQGHIATFRQQHRDLAVVLTGGDAPRFAPALKSGIFAHPTLTLIGLHAILHYDPDHGPAVPSP